MTYYEFGRVLAERCNLTYGDAKVIADMTGEIIAEQLLSGETFYLGKLGRLYRIDKKPFVVKNGLKQENGKTVTGEILATPMPVIGFKTSQNFRRELAGLTPVDETDDEFE